jgi:calcineurin-like phosphoesterase
MPVRYDVPDNPPLLCGLVAELDPKTGKTRELRRIQERAP